MPRTTDQERVLLRARAGGFSGVDISAVVYLPAIGGRADEQGIAYQLGSIQTLSYSIYSAKSPVRGLGFRNVTGYGRGGRTIAGTMMFNQLYTHPFDDVGIQSIVGDAAGILSYSSGNETFNLVKHNLENNIPLTSSEGVLGAVDGYGANADVFQPEVMRRHMWDFSWDQRGWGTIHHPSDLPPFDIILTFVNELGNIGKMILYGIEVVSEGSTLSIEDIYTEVQYNYVARDIEYFYAEDWEEARSWRSDVLLGDLDEMNGDDVTEGINKVTDNLLNVNPATKDGFSVNDVPSGYGETDGLMPLVTSRNRASSDAATKVSNYNASDGGGVSWTDGTEDRSHLYYVWKRYR